MGPTYTLQSPFEHLEFSASVISSRTEKKLLLYTFLISFIDMNKTTSLLTLKVLG